MYLQPSTSSSQRREQTSKKQSVSPLKDISNENSFLHCTGHMSAHQQSPGELQNSSSQHGLPKRQSPGAHGGPHGIGNIIGSNIPSHVEPKQKSCIRQQLGLHPQALDQRLHDKWESQSNKRYAN